MALLIQIAHSADPLPLKRKSLSRVAIASRAAVLFFISLLLLVSTPDMALAYTQGDLYRQAKASTVLIVGINDESNALSFGSGVVISEQGVVLTNAHVVEDSTRLFVYIRNQAIDTGATVLAIDSDLDLAALHIQTDLPVPFLPLAAEIPDEGTPTIAVGYPRVSDVLHMGLTLHTSVIPMTITGAAMGRSRTAGLPVPFLQTVGMLNAGSSGGPLVDSKTGELAGLVVHTVPYLEQVKNDRGERLGTAMMRAGLSYSIPVSRLRDWLQKNNIPFPAMQTREGPLFPREQERPIRAFLTTAHLLHLMAAVLHQDRDLLDLAIKQYESALQLEPERPDVLRNLGLALAAMGETDRARVTYERAFAHTPSDPVLLKNMGELKYHMRDTQGAAELYRAAVRQDACLVSAALGLGTVLQAQGRVEEAKQVLRHAAACPSSSSDAAYHIGLALEQQGLGPDALQIWENFLEQAHSASINERPILNKIRKRITKLRAQLTPQDRGINVAPVSSSAQSFVPKDAN
ncbi:MAG TPA: tetratricopeptide repeat-containing serine protease family protein [Nitrospiraceae bacterium]|nr:tetratricopeptide repeat-containing serine protease family protein [Nitrospiraceae bacterium]